MRASTFLLVLELLVELLVVRAEGAHHDVRVAVQVFGARVPHDVGAELQRPLRHNAGSYALEYSNAQFY